MRMSLYMLGLLNFITRSKLKGVTTYKYSNLYYTSNYPNRF